MTTLYVAGPMSGYPDFNIPAFRAAEQQLRCAGYRVLSPADVSQQTDLTTPSPWDWYMRRALGLLLQADGVALLTGWTGSKGAKLEHHVARTLGMPCWTVELWVEKAAKVEK